LGVQKILDSGNQELVPKFYTKYHEVISKLSGTGAWNALPLEIQQAHLARISEDLVIDLGKNVYQMMSNKEKQYLTYFVWAGCGCHKDLNSVWGGYFGMSKWWEEHKQTPPILLANHDNAAVLADMVSDSNTITPAQEQAFESTIEGQVLGHPSDFDRQRVNTQLLYLQTSLRCCLGCQKADDICFVFLMVV